MESEHAAALPACPQWDTASSTPFLGDEFIDSSKLLIWRRIFLASSQVFAVSLYSKAV